MIPSSNGSQTCKRCGVILTGSKLCEGCGLEQDNKDRNNNNNQSDSDNLIPIAQFASSDLYDYKFDDNSEAFAVATATSKAVPPNLPQVPLAINAPNVNNVNINAKISQPMGATFNISLAEQNEELLNQNKEIQTGNSTSLALSVLHLQTDSLSGAFDVPYKIRRFGIVSGSLLDFSFARFTTKIVKVRAGKFLGKIKIKIPRGVCVEVFDPLTFSTTAPTRFGVYNCNVPFPIIQVKGIAIAGGVHVIVNNDVPPIRIIT